MSSTVRHPRLAILIFLSSGSIALGQSNELVPRHGQVSVRFKETRELAPRVVEQPAASVVNKETQTPIRPVQHLGVDLRQSSPLFTVAQNPLEELGRELETIETVDDDMGGLFADLEEQTETQGPSNPSSGRNQSTPAERSDGRQLAPRTDSIGTSTRSTQSGILPPLDTADSAVSDRIPSSRTDRTPGLRDDAYYQSLGAPRVARPSTDRENIPMTLGNIFGDDDEYDPSCVQEYCNMVWDCAGGRGQSRFRRWFRDWDRSILLRNSQRCGYDMYRNDFTCPKLRSDGNQCPGGNGAPCRTMAPEGMESWPTELPPNTELGRIYSQDGPITSSGPRTIAPRRGYGRSGSNGRNRYSEIEAFEDVHMIPPMQSSTLPNSR